jgi:hypothetical protein
MNHLLTFAFEPRGLTAEDALRGLGDESGAAYHSRGQGSRRVRPRLTREQFLQANGQFFVKAGTQLDVQAVDPDVPVPWVDVVQVLLHSHEVQQCPICLAPPVAGQITRCGHVYCL